MDDGYRTAYVGLGEVRDKFQAMKSPSSRFDKVHSLLASTYASLGSTSAFAIESINQKKTIANVPEILTRLDSGRKLLEQSKAEIKALVQQFGKK